MKKCIFLFFLFSTKLVSAQTTLGVTASTYPFFKGSAVGGEVGYVSDSSRTRTFLGFEGGKLSKVSAGFTWKAFTGSWSPIFGLEGGYEFPLNIIDRHLIRNSIGEGEQQLFLQLLGGLELEMGEHFLLEVKTGFGFGTNPKNNINDAKWRIGDTGIGIHYVFAKKTE